MVGDLVGARAERVATQCRIGLLGSKRQRDLCLGAEGHRYGHAQERLVHALPGHTIRARSRVQLIRTRAQAPAHVRSHRCACKARRREVESCRIAHEPFDNGAIAVVVHGVHVNARDMPRGIEGVPALPHGGGTQIDSKQPAGVLLVQQQVVGLAVKAILAKHGAQERRAHKARLELSAILLQQATQLSGIPGPTAEAIPQRKHVGRLGVNGAATGCRVVLRLNPAANAVGKRAVVRLVACASQHMGCRHHGHGAVPPREVGHKPHVGAAHHPAGHRPIERQPVTKLEHLAPQMLRAVGLLDPVDPTAHRIKVLGQNGRVTVHLIHVPGNAAGGIAPHGRSVAKARAARGHGGRHLPATRSLLKGHVIQVLAIEGVGCRQAQRRAGEHVGVTGPPHALVALRAVGGRVEEVVAHAPARVGNELVDLGVARGYAPAVAVEVAVERNADELGVGKVEGALHLHVAVAIEGEVRTQQQHAP